MRAELKVVEGKHKGAIIPINRKKFLVGRETDCQLRPNSDLVSRHHCVFSTDDYGVRLRDLGSTNGTYVNGERINGQVPLHDGDQVRIGKLTFQIAIRSGVAAAAAAIPISGVPSGVIPPSSSMTAEFSLSESGMLKIDETANKTGVFGGDTTLLNPNTAQKTVIDVSNPLQLNRPTPLPPTQSPTQFIPSMTPPPAVAPEVEPPAPVATGVSAADVPPPVQPAGTAPKASAADIIRQYMQKRSQ